MKYACHFVSGEPPRYDGLGQCGQILMFRLVALNLTYQSLSGNVVRFVILGLTKTRRNRPPMKAFYSAFPEDPKFCPVQSLPCYEKTSQKTVVKHREHTKKSTAYFGQQAPKPDKTATIGHWLKAS